MYRVVRAHHFRHKLNTYTLELIWLDNKEFKELKSYYKWTTRFMLQISDSYGEATGIEVTGLDLNKKKSAIKAFDMFCKKFDDKDVADMFKEGFIHLYVGDQKKKKPKTEYYTLIPKASDGIVKVMRTKPPEFVLDYSYVEGPFSSPKAVKKRLNLKNIPNFRRPKDYWNLEGY